MALRETGAELAVLAVPPAPAEVEPGAPVDRVETPPPFFAPYSPETRAPTGQPSLLPRTRLMLAVGLGVASGLLLVDVQQDVLPLWPAALAVVVLLGASIALRGAPATGRTRWIGAGSISIAAFLLSSPPRFAGDPTSIPLLALVIAFAAAAFVPWGPAAQTALSSVLALCVLRDAVAGPAPTPTALFIMLLGFAATVVLTQRGSRFLAAVRASMASLEVSEASLRELTETMSDVSWMTSPDGQQILYVSAAYERIWGRDRATLRDRPEDWLDGVHPDERARVARALAGVAGGGAFDEEYRVIRPDGTQRWVHARGQPVRDDAGRMKGIAGLAQDVTDRRAAEDARMLRGLAAHLQRAREDERRRLARRLHDDLAQHMTAIGLGVSWLTRKVPPGPDGLEPQLRDITSLVESTVRMLRGVIAELRPTELDDFGLAEAVRWQAREFETRTSVPCNVLVPETGASCGHDCRVGVFRMFQELLAYAGAVDGIERVDAELRETDESIVLSVTVGIDDAIAVAPSPLATLTAVAMRERAHTLGGTVDADEACLRVEVRIPARQ